MCLSSKNINSEKFNLFTFCRARPNIKCHLQVELQLLKASTQAENFSKEYRLNSALIVVILDRTSRQNSSPLRIESVDSSKRMHKSLHTPYHKLFINKFIGLFRSIFLIIQIFQYRCGLYDSVYNM